MAHPEARPVGIGKAVGSTPTIGSTSSFTHQIVPPDDDGPDAMGYRPPSRKRANPAPRRYSSVVTVHAIRLLRRDTFFEIAAWLPGPDVVGYLVMDTVLAGSSPAAAGHRTGWCSHGTHFVRVFQAAPDARAVIDHDDRPCDGPETVGYLCQTKSHGQEFRPSSIASHRRFGPEGSGYLNSRSQVRVLPPGKPVRSSEDRAVFFPSDAFARTFLTSQQEAQTCP